MNVMSNHEVTVDKFGARGCLLGELRHFIESGAGPLYRLLTLGVYKDMAVVP